MERILTITIDDEWDGREIKAYLKGALNMSSRLITKLKQREAGILLNGEPVYVVKRLSRGDVLTLKLSDEADVSLGIVPKQGDFEIVYEDDDLILINKPPNLPVHPSMGNYYDTLANYVAYHYKSMGQGMTFRPINRLDRNTSGLMLVAKNSYAQDFMAREHKEGRLRREYLAIAMGSISEDSGIIEAPIARADASAIKREVREDGRYALTEYEVIERFSCACVVRLKPVTGRTHQIRVHMAHIGHPLMGDFLYGEECDEISRHALHSYRIEFTTPHSKEHMVFEIPMAEDMRAALRHISGGKI